MLEREQAERREAESAVSELKRQFAVIKEKCASVDVEIDQYTEEVNTLRRGQTLQTHVYAFFSDLYGTM